MSRLRWLPVAIMLAACSSAGGLPAHARHYQRPRVAPGEDPRDWHSYLNCAVTTASVDTAHACLYWARRLDPARAEPLYGQWILSGHRVDSLHREALARDPFVYRARVLPVSERRYGVFTRPEARAWGALEASDYYQAAGWFESIVAGEPGNVDARRGAAIAQYHRKEFDTSARHVRALDSLLRLHRDRRPGGAHFDPKVVAHMEAVAWAAAGQAELARAALERALAHDLVYVPAWMLLGDLELTRGDTVGADAAWSQAARLRGGDAFVRGRVGEYLLRRVRPDAAERELRTALTTEPHWVDARWHLARALDGLGPARAAEAAAAYRDFLRRAPAADGVRRGHAAWRADALAAP